MKSLHPIQEDFWKLYTTIKRASPRGDFFPHWFFHRTIPSPGASGSQWCGIPMGWLNGDFVGSWWVFPRRQRFHDDQKAESRIPMDVSQDPWDVHGIFSMNGWFLCGLHGSANIPFVSWILWSIWSSHARESRLVIVSSESSNGDWLSNDNLQHPKGVFFGRLNCIYRYICI